MNAELKEQVDEILADEDCTCTPAKGIIRNLMAEIEQLEQENKNLEARLVRSILGNGQDSMD